MDYALSLSHGKDSMAAIYVVKEILHWPLDRIISADVWATDTISADLPPMVDFKNYADDYIFDRWGIRVEYCRSKWTFESRFYSKLSKKARPELQGRIRGFPLTKGSWCSRDLKVRTLVKGCSVNYIGIAADEQKRFSQLSERTISPLVEAGWTEEMCWNWCDKNGLLSPIYKNSCRGGCWFCPKQPVDQLRILRKKYNSLWQLLLKLDIDSPVTFKSGYKDKDGILHPGHTVHDFDRRFQMEDKGLIFPDDKVFRWSMLDDDCMTYRLF